MVSQDKMTAYVVVASGWVHQATLDPSYCAAGSYVARERQTQAVFPTVISTPTNLVGA